MRKSRFPHIILTLTLALLMLFSFTSAVMADDATPTSTAPVATDLTFSCDIPSYAENTSTSFYYNVLMTYTGEENATVNLSTTPPVGWTSWVTYSSKQVTSVPMEATSNGQTDSKSLSITLSPISGRTPEPGEYKLLFKATTGDVSEEIELTAIIKASYAFSLTTESGNLAMNAVAGKENTLTVEMSNTGSADLENITMNDSKPDGWTITWSPESIETLEAGQTVQANVVITPPKDKTVAGDYNITLRANNANVSSNIVVRVTVDTPTVWGWVSIVIIILVLAGLAFLFMKLGRR
jgi:uncharacterized membrane protein